MRESLDLSSGGFFHSSPSLSVLHHCTLQLHNFLSFFLAGCGWLSSTAAAAGPLCCTRSTDGWSRPSCSTTRVSRSFGTTPSWRDCWTPWPRPRVLRCAFARRSPNTINEQNLHRRRKSVRETFFFFFYYFIKLSKLPGLFLSQQWNATPCKIYSHSLEVKWKESSTSVCASEWACWPFFVKRFGFSEIVWNNFQVFHRSLNGVGF